MVVVLLVSLETKGERIPSKGICLGLGGGKYFLTRAAGPRSEDDQEVSGASGFCGDGKRQSVRAACDWFHGDLRVKLPPSLLRGLQGSERRSLRGLLLQFEGNHWPQSELE